MPTVRYYSLVPSIDLLYHVRGYICCALAVCTPLGCFVFGLSPCPPCRVDQVSEPLVAENNVYELILVPTLRVCRVDVLAHRDETIINPYF